MDQPTSPFSKQQLLPQEEMLEIFKQKGELFIGVPRENQYQEKRICLTPDAVTAITANGHRVMIESGAGEGAFYSDVEYANAGAEIVRDTKKVFACPMILKVEPPTFEEIKMINPQSIVISALQIQTQSKKYFEELAKKRYPQIAKKLSVLPEQISQAAAFIAHLLGGREPVATDDESREVLRVLESNRILLPAEFKRLAGWN